MQIANSYNVKAYNDPQCQPLQGCAEIREFYTSSHALLRDLNNSLRVTGTYIFIIPQNVLFSSPKWPMKRLTDLLAMERRIETVTNRMPGPRRSGGSGARTLH